MVTPGNGTSSFYQIVPCTVNPTTHIVTIPAFTLPSTLDGTQATALSYGRLYDESGAPREFLWSGWSLSNLPTSLPFNSWFIFNLGSSLSNPPDSYLNSQEVIALIDSLVTGISQGVRSEVPAGVINGVNGTFTLSATPTVGSLLLFLNGNLQEEGSLGAGTESYTLSGATITHNLPPQTGDWLYAVYRTASPLISTPTTATQIIETGGPTVLSVGAIPDLNLFKRSGSTVVGVPDTLPVADVSFFATGGTGTSANPWTGWDTAITWASDTRYNFRRGWYSYATWPAGINGLHRVSWIGEGKGQSYLKYTGAANAVNYLSSVLLPTCQFELAGFSIVGNASAKKGVYLEEAHHSTLRDISVRSFTEHGFLFKGCVLNDYYNLDCSRQSDDAVLWTPIPAVGIEVSNNGGQLSSVNVFYNPIVEFLPTCFLITNAWNTTVIGGSMEGLGAADPDSPLFGFFIGAGADTTTIIGGDHEGCITANLRIQGTAENTVCINVYFPGGLVDIVDAARTKFIGGRLDDVTIGVAGGIVELDCEVTGVYTNNSPAGDRYRARILTVQPVSGTGDVALQLYNGAGGNLWRWRQTAASNDLRMSFESLVGLLTDFLVFNSVTGSASFLNDVSITNDLDTSTVKVGATGTVLTLLLKGTVTINPASIGATTVSSQNFALTGALVGDSLQLNPPAAGLDAGIVVGQAFVSATNQITVIFHNTTVGAIDIASASWTYALIRS